MHIYRARKPESKRRIVEIVLDGFIGKRWAAPLKQRGFTQPLPFVTIVWYGLREGAVPHPLLRLHEVGEHAVAQADKSWWFVFWLRYFREVAHDLFMRVKDDGAEELLPWNLGTTLDAVYHDNCFEQEAYAVEGAARAGTIALPDWAARPQG